MFGFNILKAQSLGHDYWEIVDSETPGSSLEDYLQKGLATDNVGPKNSVVSGKQ